MKLKDSGTIQVDGYNVRRTDSNQWLITKRGTVVSYVDALSEVYPAIDYHVARVRARAAKAEADATQAKEKASWNETLLNFTDQEAQEAGNKAADMAVDDYNEAQARLAQAFDGPHLGNILSF